MQLDTQATRVSVPWPGGHWPGSMSRLSAGEAHVATGVSHLLYVGIHTPDTPRRPLPAVQGLRAAALALLLLATPAAAWITGRATFYGAHAPWGHTVDGGRSKRLHGGLHC